jgi:hypothetical protein
MVDAADLKSASCKGVWVRVPPSAVKAPSLLDILKLELLNVWSLGGRLPCRICDRYDALTPISLANCFNDTLFFTSLYHSMS